MLKLDESTITAQGQISIPKKIRAKLNLQKGDKIAFFEDDKGQIIIQELESPISLSSDQWSEFLDKTRKERLTRVKSKKQALAHLDQLTKK